MSAFAVVRREVVANGMRVSVLKTTNKPARTHGVGISILRYAPSRFVEPLLGIITIPILTRVLEPAGYGDFKTLILTVGLARIIGFDWINNCALRFFRPMEKDRRRYQTNLLVGLLIGIVVLSAAWGALALGARWIDDSGSRAKALLPFLLSFAPWMFLTALADGFARNGEMTFWAMQRPWAFTVVRISLALSRHGLGLACLVLASNSLAAYLGAWSCGALVVALWVWVATGGWRQVSTQAVSVSALRSFVVFGFPITFVLLANAAQTVGIRYVLQYFLGADATGLFSAAYDLGGVPVIVFQSIVMLGLYPLAIDAYEKDGRIDGIIHDGLRYFVIAAIPVVLLLAVLARPALTVFAGRDYEGAWPVLSISCAGTLAFGLSQYFSLRFLVAKQTGRWALINLTAATSNIVASCWLVPAWGYGAAAVTTAGAQVLILIGAVVWGGGIHRSQLPVRSFVYTGIACLPMMLVWWVFKRYASLSPFWYCAAVCVVGGLSYLAVLWWLGALRRERDALLGLWRRVRARGDGVSRRPDE